MSLRAVCPLLLLFMLLLAAAPRSFAIQPPALSVDLEQHSALTYFIGERNFVERYLFDPTYGGAYFSADGQGNVVNDSKNIIFQTNVILFLAGMVSTQSPDPQTKTYVDSAARFVVDHLKWGTYGPGTWIFSTDRNGSNPVQMVPGGVAATEAYFSYGLLWAYKITGNSEYLNVARTNLDTEMRLMPDGHIQSNLPLMSWDATYRSPERMTYYFMWQLTGNSSYLDYAKKVQAAILGANGWEIHDYGNGTRVKLYLHGNSVIDEIQYALVTGDQGALNESRQRVIEYTMQGHDDHATGAEQGREYHQKLLTMNLGMWTITGELQYRDAATREYQNLVKFWDPSPPYGFWTSLAKETKTCFSRGYPMADLTSPTIQADPTDVHVTATITDPSWEWLGLNYTPIGVNPQTAQLFYSFDGQTWAGSLALTQAGADTYTATVPQNIASLNPQYLISSSDYFNNTSTFGFTKQQQIVSTATTTSGTTTTAAASGAVSSMGIGFVAVGIGAAGAALAVGLGFALPPGRAGTGPVDAGYVYSRCPYWGQCGSGQYPVCYVNWPQNAMCYPTGPPVCFDARRR